jgi:hypothetical protein
LSSILVTWPKWLLALLVIPLGLFVGYGLTSIVFEPWSFSHTFAIFEMAVVYWLMLFALFSKREATR